MHLRCLQFYNRLKSGCIDSPATILYSLLGMRERNSIALLYNISDVDKPMAIRSKIWAKFELNLDVVS